MLTSECIRELYPLLAYDRAETENDARERESEGWDTALVAICLRCDNQHNLISENMPRSQDEILPYVG